MAPAQGWPPYRPEVDSLAQLAAGADRGLDVVCKGILEGSPFTYPADQLDQQELA
jgi:hypothetical protein